MPIVEGRFMVDAPAGLAFEVTNRLEDWPTFSPSCAGVSVLGTEGKRTTFRVTHTDGQEWVSRIFRSPAGMFTFSERVDPPGPYAAMQYIRTYRDAGGGRAEVTEKVNYEVRSGDPQEEEAAARGIRAHMAGLHPAIKAYIERVAVSRG